MARVFKRKDRLSAMSEINITSLLDLVFCLLIIFMITTPLLEQSIPVKLPSQAANSGDQPDPKLKYQSVTVNSQGNYFLGKDPVTLEQLEAEFKRFAALPDPPVIAVRGDESVPYGKVAEIYILGKKAGLKQMGIETQAR